MAVFGVLALGETFVIITAGIDLSVGSMVGLTGVICAEEMTSNISVPVVIITVLLFGVAIGLINGTLVAVAKVPPFIVTLGMLGILRGAAFLVTGGLNLSLSASGAPTPYANWVNATFLGVPNIFAVLIVLGIVAHLFLRYTRRGRYVYALGSNPESARRAGINVIATILTVYVLSAVLASAAGLLTHRQIERCEPQ